MPNSSIIGKKEEGMGVPRKKEGEKAKKKS